MAGDQADARGLAYDCLQTALILTGSSEAAVEKLLAGSKRWDTFVSYIEGSQMVASGTVGW